MKLFNIHKNYVLLLVLSLVQTHLTYLEYIIWKVNGPVGKFRFLLKRSYLLKNFDRASVALPSFIIAQVFF